MALVGLAVQVAALNVVERGRAERKRRLRRILAAADNVDVGGVVHAGGRRDLAPVENALVDRQSLTGAGRHEHDVHQALLDDLLDDVAEFGQAAVTQLAAVRLGRLAGRADRQSHVRVLGVGEDEVLAAVRIGVDAGQFLIE